MAAESLRIGLLNETQLKNHRSFSNYYPKTRASANFSSRAFRASQEPIDGNKNKFYKELGLFSLRKRIEDSVLRAETLAPAALELEEAKHINQEEVIRDCDLWDDLSKSNEVLNKLADSAKVVDTLRDLKYKAEEAKLITELAEMDAINYPLFKQAYSASIDVNKFLDEYEMSKLLKEPYDMEGACITLKSRCGDTYSEKWAGQLTQMYMKWAKRQGHAGRIVERSPSNNGGLKSVTIELEFKFAYGYLSGERGIHSMIRSSQNTSTQPEVSFAFVDVIPLFIESSLDLSIDDEDILVSYPSSCEEDLCRTSLAVHIQHIPTGLEVESTGERSCFANKIKALNRLKAKLLIIMRDQGLSSVKSVKKGAKMDPCSQETRKYVFQPSKMVHDLKSGLQLPDVNDVLNGYLDPLIAAHINSRQTSTINLLA
ncbi:Mitochondrial polypeptide chain release factor [Handroanthus impetiginosus]|uniref:Mitochondrial polypeptide chain release factor n=1 Tax=Handroanthus impetiginosus TaxID=429701 RepID=A0A2G9HU41_9LAMI|nr:Mitochondrial polypeptide chain release factor [Handroanthus impetiginosus]